MVYRLAAFDKVGSKVLMPLLGCEGVFFTSVEVKPELGSLDLVEKSGTDMNVRNAKFIYANELNRNTYKSK